MASKNIFKTIEYGFAWMLLQLCSLIIRHISQKYLYGFVPKIGYLGYILAGRHRDIAFEGLSQAFGKKKSSRQIKQIARDCFISMAKSGAELLFAMNRPGFVRNNFKIIGRENIDRALSKGKGVILVSAHFGNFPMILARLGLEGYKTSVILRPMKDQRMEELFEPERARLDIEAIYSIPRKICVETAIRSLRNNRLLFIPLDQNFGTGGVYVDFFGRKAATATGPVVLARRTQAVILLCFIIRQKDDSHHIIFEPALDIKRGSSTEETTIINIQRITETIESYICKYPEQWSWIHRRWKSRPRES
jgi:KDO2-lipid IV(A) lauroyltransferase